MPESVEQLLTELKELRLGRGHIARRADLRRRLAMIDPGLLARRQSERLRLAELHNQARHDAPAALRAAVDQSARQLRALDRAVAEAVAKLPTMAPLPDPAATLRQRVDPDVVAEAQAALRGRLYVVDSLIGGLPLPSRLQGAVRSAVAVAIQRLGK